MLRDLLGQLGNNLVIKLELSQTLYQELELRYNTNHLITKTINTNNNFSQYQCMTYNSCISKFKIQLYW